MINVLAQAQPAHLELMLDGPNPAKLISQKPSRPFSFLAWSIVKLLRITHLSKNMESVNTEKSITLRHFSRKNYNFLPFNTKY